MPTVMSRRQFLGLSAGATGMAVASGLGSLSGSPRPAAAAAWLAGAPGATELAKATEAVEVTEPTGGVRVLMRDVLDFRLDPGEGPALFGPRTLGSGPSVPGIPGSGMPDPGTFHPGHFDPATVGPGTLGPGTFDRGTLTPGAVGHVTFRLHQGFQDGRIVHFIRTDASDAEYAERHGLAYTPLLSVVSQRELQNRVYGFANGQPPVLRDVPGMKGYTPLFRIHRVSGAPVDRVFRSEAEIETAAAAGQLRIEDSGVRVTLPLVQWGEESLPVDGQGDRHVGTGQLLAAPDLERRRVTFKLHWAYPNRGYILTDTSSAPMGPILRVPVSPYTAGLATIKATGRIWSFANGVAGSGALGHQPAILGSPPVPPSWSPFRDHFTLRWKDSRQARIVRSANEIEGLVEAGVLRQYHGTPETHPEGFVVHCPVPVIAL